MIVLSPIQVRKGGEREEERRERRDRDQDLGAID